MWMTRQIVATEILLWTWLTGPNIPSPSSSTHGRCSLHEWDMKIGGLICRYWSWQQSLLLGAFGTHQEKVQENLAGQSPIANCPTKIHDFLFLESFYPLSLHSPLWPEICLTKNQTRPRPREAVGGLNIVYNDYQILMSIADQNCKRPHHIDHRISKYVAIRW